MHSRAGKVCVGAKSLPTHTFPGELSCFAFKPRELATRQTNRVRLPTEGFRAPVGNVPYEGPKSEVRLLEIEVTLSRQRGIAGSADTVDGDKALARQIAAGDTAAWRRFFDRYLTWAYRFAYAHLGGNSADA